MQIRKRNFPEDFPKIFSEILSLLNTLSFKAMGYSSPNPPVACVITDLNGNILSYGHTQRHGENHAEREAYRYFAKKFSSSEKIPHLVFVTLEPCTHFGKTPPCLDLILEFGPQCVFFGLSDPNPLLKVRNGFNECKKLGIELIQNKEIAELGKVYLSGFISRIVKSRPQVIIKSALSLEGNFSSLSKTRIALSNNFSNQITKMLRAKLDAVVVGPGTVYHDSPGLDFRKFEFEDSKYFDKVALNAQFKSKELNTKGFILNAFDREICEFHNVNFKNFQPYRIFIISMNMLPSFAFIQKQRELNERLESKKTAFLFLNFDSNNTFHAEYYSDISKLTNTSPKIISNEKEILPIILSLLQELSINTLLVEGGNLLYELFSENLFSKDLVYLIRTEKSIPNGIRPKIDLNQLKKYFELELDANLWEGYEVL